MIRKERAFLRARTYRNGAKARRFAKMKVFASAYAYSLCVSLRLSASAVEITALVGILMYFIFYTIIIGTYRNGAKVPKDEKHFASAYLFIPLALLCDSPPQR